MMARTEARIRCAVWRNRDFTSLPLESQGLYWMLLSQPDVSLAGVVPYNRAKWERLCTGDVDEALAPLEMGGFVMPDPTTGELWIRTFTKHDGVLNGPKTRAGMWSAWHNILSVGVRWRFVDHLDQELIDEAIEAGWIAQDDLDDARKDFDNEPQNRVCDGVSREHEDGVSDRASLARAESASDSASDSDSTPVGNGNAPFVKRLADEIGYERKEHATRFDAFHELLSYALERIPDHRHHDTTMGVIADFVQTVQGFGLTREARSHTARLVRNHPPGEVLRAYGEALNWGAGISADYANDPLALSKYVAGILSKTNRGAA